ncbi:MAG: hypothetical protein KGH88_01720, partial [Thaumarchaeota archaeon]|nr:hypothetical protein [Nitrososphaerota archaeon]
AFHLVQNALLQNDVSMIRSYIILCSGIILLLSVQPPNFLIPLELISRSLPAIVSAIMIPC